MGDRPWLRSARAQRPSGCLCRRWWNLRTTLQVKVCCISPCIQTHVHPKSCLSVDRGYVRLGRTCAPARPSVSPLQRRTINLIDVQVPAQLPVLPPTTGLSRNPMLGPRHRLPPPLLRLRRPPRRYCDTHIISTSILVLDGLTYIQSTACAGVYRVFRQQPLAFLNPLQARTSGKVALPQPEVLAFDRLVVDAATMGGKAKFVIEHRKAAGCLLATVMVSLPLQDRLGLTPRFAAAMGFKTSRTGLPD